MPGALSSLNILTAVVISFPVKNGASVVSGAILVRLLITPCSCMSSWLSMFVWYVCSQQTLCRFLYDFVICSPLLLMTFSIFSLFACCLYIKPYGFLLPHSVTNFFQLSYFILLIALLYWRRGFWCSFFKILIVLVLWFLDPLNPWIVFLFRLPFFIFDFLKTLFFDIDTSHASNIISCNSPAIFSASSADFGLRIPSLDPDRFFKFSLNRSQLARHMSNLLFAILWSFAVLGALSPVSTGLWSLVVNSRLIFYVPMS